MTGTVVIISPRDTGVHRGPGRGRRPTLRRRMIKHLVTVPARRGRHGTQREGAVDWYQQELCPQGPAGRPPAPLSFH